MLRWIILAVVVVVLTGVATFLSVNAPDAVESPTVSAPVVAKGPQPTVEVPEPLTHEFGVMPQLSEGKHTWEFKNLGDADLELWFESSTCSCTVAKLKSADGKEKPKLVIKPKDSTTIDLEWQTKTFHDDYTKGATIGTNDPKRPSVSINVHGNVQPPVIVVPDEMIKFTGVSNEQSNFAQIAVFSADRPGTKVTKLSTSRPEFILARTKALTPQECKQLKVKAGNQVMIEIKPGMPLGRFHEELVIETDHPLKSDLKVSVTGSITGPISVIPEKLNIPSVSSSQGASRDMTILVRGGTPTKFTVAFKPEKLVVDVKPDDTPTQKGRYKMTVSVPPGTSGGQVEGDIILKTDHPKVSEMKIPVNVLISNSGAD